MTGPALILVTTSYPSSFDGSEAAGSFVEDLARSLAEFVNVRVVAPGQTESIEKVGGIDIWRYSSGSRPLSLLSATKVGDWVTIVTTLRSMRKQTEAAASDGRVSNIFALWVLPSGWAAAKVARKMGISYSVWALGSDIWSLGRIPLVRAMLKSVARGAEHRFADGLQLAEDAEALTQSNFQFLPSSRALHAPPRLTFRESGPYRLLFLGRWHVNKGVDLLMEALGMLPDDVWAGIEDVHIAGGGPLDTLVRHSVGTLVASGRPVRLSGFLDRSKAREALERADYLLIPSRIESIPVVFSDAMQMGLPVITMPVGDLPTLVVEEQVGVVARAVTAPDLAGAIAEAIATSPAFYTVALASCAEKFVLDGKLVLQKLQGPEHRHRMPNRE